MNIQQTSSVAQAGDTSLVPEGRYGWYVETEQLEPADSIFVGDYISVNSQGRLFIWGPHHEVRHEFEPGSWGFVFPQFLIEEVGEDGVHNVIVLGAGDNEPYHPSKTLAFYCQLPCEACIGISATVIGRWLSVRGMAPS